MNNFNPSNNIKTIIKLAAPIILAQLFQIAYQITDAFWIGRLGEEAIASVAMSMPIIFFMTSLGIGLAIAGSTLTAQYFGAKDEKMLSKAAAQTMLMVSVVSVIFSIIGYLNTENILRLLGTDGLIIAKASSYLRIAFLGLIFNFSFFIFQSIMRSIGKPQTPVYIVIGTVILNFILDPLFMFGFGPLPAMGISGVALATIITQSLAAGIGLYLLFAGQHGIYLHYRDFRPDIKFIKKAFLLGLPASIEQSTRSLALTITTAMIATFGTLAVAAYGVGSTILQVILMITFGLAGANAALVGQKLGAGEPALARSLAHSSLKIAVITLSALGALVFLSAPILISLFAPGDQAVIDAGANYLRFIAPIFGLLGVQIIIGSTLQASGNTTRAMSLTLTSQWLLQIPLIYLLPRLYALGLNGVWLAFPLTNIVMAIIYFIVFKRSAWEKKKLISAANKLNPPTSEEEKLKTATT